MRPASPKPASPRPPASPRAAGDRVQMECPKCGYCVPQWLNDKAHCLKCQACLRKREAGSQGPGVAVHAERRQVGESSTYKAAASDARESEGGPCSMSPTGVHQYKFGKCTHCQAAEPARPKPQGAAKLAASGPAGAAARNGRGRQGSPAPSAGGAPPASPKSRGSSICSEAEAAAPGGPTGDAAAKHADRADRVQMECPTCGYKCTPQWLNDSAHCLKCQAVLRRREAGSKGPGVAVHAERRQVGEASTHKAAASDSREAEGGPCSKSPTGVHQYRFGKCSHCRAAEPARPRAPGVARLAAPGPAGAARSGRGRAMSPAAGAGGASPRCGSLFSRSASPGARGTSASPAPPEARGHARRRSPSASQPRQQPPPLGAAAARPTSGQGPPAPGAAEAEPTGIASRKPLAPGAAEAEPPGARKPPAAGAAEAKPPGSQAPPAPSAAKATAPGVEKEDHAALERARIQLQAAWRGSLARRELRAQRDKDAAAREPSAAGPRAALVGPPGAATAARDEEDLAAVEVAATRLQAARRGELARRELGTMGARQDEEEHRHGSRAGVEGVPTIRIARRATEAHGAAGPEEDAESEGDSPAVGLAEGTAAAQPEARRDDLLSQKPPVSASSEAAEAAARSRAEEGRRRRSLHARESLAEGRQAPANDALEAPRATTGRAEEARRRVTPDSRAPDGGSGAEGRSEVAARALPVRGGGGGEGAEGAARSQPGPGRQAPASEALGAPATPGRAEEARRRVTPDSRAPDGGSGAEGRSEVAARALPVRGGGGGEGAEGAARSQPGPGRQAPASEALGAPATPGRAEEARRRVTPDSRAPDGGSGAEGRSEVAARALPVRGGGGGEGAEGAARSQPGPGRQAPASEALGAPATPGREEEARRRVTPDSRAPDGGSGAEGRSEVAARALPVRGGGGGEGAEGAARSQPGPGRQAPASDALGAPGATPGRDSDEARRRRGTPDGEAYDGASTPSACGGSAPPTGQVDGARQGAIAHHAADGHAASPTRRSPLEATLDREISPPYLTLDERLEWYRSRRGGRAPSTSTSPRRPGPPASPSTCGPPPSFQQASSRVEGISRMRARLAWGQPANDPPSLAADPWRPQGASALGQRTSPSVSPRLQGASAWGQTTSPDESPRLQAASAGDKPAPADVSPWLRPASAWGQPAPPEVPPHLQAASAWGQPASFDVSPRLQAASAWGQPASLDVSPRLQAAPIWGQPASLDASPRLQAAQTWGPQAPPDVSSQRLQGLSAASSTASPRPLAPRPSAQQADAGPSGPWAWLDAQAAQGAGSPPAQRPGSPPWRDPPLGLGDGRQADGPGRSWALGATAPKEGVAASGWSAALSASTAAPSASSPWPSRAGSQPAWRAEGTPAPAASGPWPSGGWAQQPESPPSRTACSSRDTPRSAARASRTSTRGCGAGPRARCGARAEPRSRHPASSSLRLPPSSPRALCHPSAAVSPSEGARPFLSRTPTPQERALPPHPPPL
ncbi:unnamed protein product [Prorocentrum cordatum]|uniref:Uncharacterized protein n=1 Tax=Prorocentrum cordatum TaxID=2364126 RepID=A0ABN9UHL6_9DINO|nr:unnamed protein product [Polarella glacialis]